MAVASCIEELLDFDPEPVGSGASGVVRVARDAGGRVFAVKTCRKDLCPRWRDEEAVHSQLDHPNVVPLFHALDEPDRIHFLMEYCAEGDLEKLLSKEPAISEFQVASIVYQMLQSIDYIHGKGFCHADVHLKNFVVQLCKGRKRCLKLMDFGVGGILEDGRYFSRLGGTNELLSPEIARALMLYSGVTGATPEEASAAFRWDGRAADMWALGCIAFSLLDDRRFPFSCTLETELDHVIETLASGECEQHELHALRALNEQIVIGNETQKLMMFARIAANDRRRLPKSDICKESSGEAHLSHSRVSRAGCVFVEGLLHTCEEQRYSAKDAINSVWMRSFIFDAIYRCVRNCVRHGLMQRDFGAEGCFLVCDLQESDAELRSEESFTLLLSSDVEEMFGCILSFIPECDASIDASLSTLTCAHFFLAAQYFRAEGCWTSLHCMCPCLSPHPIGSVDRLLHEVHTSLLL